MKKISRYSLPNPVNVKDPRTDGYTVVVHPCQDIQLFLTDPINLFKDAAAGDEWEVKAYSNYFYLDAVSEGPGKKQFNFIQFYDLTPWTNHSSVYLGDIEVTLNSKTVSENFSLCVIARSVGKQSRIVTAVNPVVNRIKLDLDEILEVVVSKDDPAQPKEEVWCSLYDMGRSGTGNGSQWFERLRQEVVILPDSSPLPRDHSNLYLTMSRSVASLRSNPGLPKETSLPPAPTNEVQSQHHFWFRVRPEDKAAVLRANTGLPMANVVFNGTSGSCSNLQVLVSTRGTRTEPTVPEYDKDRYEGHFRGLVGRHYYPSTGLLINPGKAEGTVEMTPTQGGVMVELAPPQITWPYTDPKYRWHFDVEPVVEDNAAPVLPGFLPGKSQHKRVICTELTDRTINQNTVQRFFVKPECELPEGEDMLYLGVVNFWCKEPSVIGKRTINFWLVRQRTVNDENDAPSADRYKAVLLPSSPKSRGSGRPTPPPPSSKRTLALAPYTPPIKYDKVVVRITEQRDDGLTAPGAVTVPFQSIKIEKREKNGSCCVVTYTAEDYDRYAGISQKKNEENKSKSSSSSQSNASGERRGRSPGSSLSPRFSGGSGSVGRASSGNARVVVDPEEHTLIQVSPGQDVVIRLPVKHWDMKDDIGYYWMFNPIQLKHNQFFIREQQMVRVGRRLYHEVVVSLLPRNAPREIGKFILGGIQCCNRHETRYVAIQLVIDNLIFSDSNPEYSKALRGLMQSLKVSRAANQKREIEEAKAGINEAIADLHATLSGEKPPERKRGLIHDPKVVASLEAAFRQSAEMTLAQQEQSRRRAEEEAAFFAQSQSPPCKMIRNPTGGESIELGCDDTVRVVLTDKLVTVDCYNSSHVMEQPWTCRGTPRWLDLAETVVCKGEKSFVFKVNKNVRFPTPEEIQFSCGEEVRIIRVRHTYDDRKLIEAMGS